MFYGETRIEVLHPKLIDTKTLFRIYILQTTYYQLPQETSYPFVESSALSIDYYFLRNNLYIILFRKINQKNFHI